jgi:hypothetical protein
VFSFGGTFAHVITFNTYQRLLALDALRKLGVHVDSVGCPSEYEASMQRAGSKAPASDRSSGGD